MTCEQALDFEQKASNLWAAWVSASETEDPQEWDAACESYITGMDDLRQEFGHPPSRPRRRPA